MRVRFRFVRPGRVGERYGLTGTVGTMRLYDTGRGEIVDFEPGPTVTMYVCGITPYDATHLGHAATYVTYDVLQRRLIDLGHEVRYVRNITDVDDDILAAAARRIARYRPRTVTADVLKPLPADAAAPEGGFDSVGLCYLLHCLPGALPEKAAAVFDHVRPLMTEDAVLFGATIVQGDAPRSRPAQRLMGLYNRKGIFSNADDTEPDLRAALEARFADVRLWKRHTFRS